MKKIKYPKGVKVVYDSGPNKGLDRYTVYYSDRKAWGYNKVISPLKLWPCVAMNAAPFHPQGFGQHSSGMLGRHNGKRIPFEALPADCQRLVKRDLAQ